LAVAELVTTAVGLTTTLKSIGAPVQFVGTTPIGVNLYVTVTGSVPLFVSDCEIWPPMARPDPPIAPVVPALRTIQSAVAVIVELNKISVELPLHIFGALLIDPVVFGMSFISKPKSADHG
jgi:hypothetical protein